MFDTLHLSYDSSYRRNFLLNVVQFFSFFSFLIIISQLGISWYKAREMFTFSMWFTLVQIHNNNSSNRLYSTVSNQQE